eukprot:356123-Chlamydomonas_euryale.AAC.11
MPHLGQKPWVVDKNTVHALLEGMEKADFLAVHIDHTACVPAVHVLVVAARRSKREGRGAHTSRRVGRRFRGGGGRCRGDSGVVAAAAAVVGFAKAPRA